MRIFNITAGYYEWNVWLGNKLVYSVGDVSSDLPEKFDEEAAKLEAEFLADGIVEEFDNDSYYERNKTFTQPRLPLSKGEYTHLKNECYNKIYARYID